MRVRISVVAVLFQHAAAGCSKGRQPAAEEEAFFCNVKGLTSAQRARHQELTRLLRGAVLEQRELDDGYGFRIATDRMDLSQVAEWAVLERRCCPFFTFTMELERREGPTWLRLTGAPGVKAFIRSELGMGRELSASAAAR